MSIIHLIGAGLASSLFYLVAPEELHVFSRTKKVYMDVESGILVNDHTPLLTWPPFFLTIIFGSPSASPFYGKWRLGIFVASSIVLTRSHRFWVFEILLIL